MKGVPTGANRHGQCPPCSRCSACYSSLTRQETRRRAGGQSLPRGTGYRPSGYLPVWIPFWQEPRTCRLLQSRCPGCRWSWWCRRWGPGWWCMTGLCGVASCLGCSCPAQAPVWWPCWPCQGSKGLWMGQGTVRVPGLASRVPGKENKGQIKTKSGIKICSSCSFQFPPPVHISSLSHSDKCLYLAHSSPADFHLNSRVLKRWVNTTPHMPFTLLLSTYTRAKTQHPAAQTCSPQASSQTSARIGRFGIR